MAANTRVLSPRLSSRRLFCDNRPSDRIPITLTSRLGGAVSVTDGSGKEKFLTQHAKPRVKGIDMLRDPRLSKGTAFSLKERQYLAIHGLLPPRFMTPDEQVIHVTEAMRREQDDLSRYTYLNDLQDRNEKLFYRVICENVEDLMPIVYTPTVGLACQKFGLIFKRPKGLYITIHDNNIDQIYQILANWPERDVRAVVMTDGERILGLGDLGAYGMGIPVGKLSLYVALGGIYPRYCLPILVDVGTNNEKLLNDPFYIGLRQKRATGEEYDRLIDNIMTALVMRYGNDTLIQFEDFANHNAFRFLEKYRDKYCTFNDDIQGTASVVVAGLLAAKRVTNKPLRDHKFLFFDVTPYDTLRFLGAGEAAVGIAHLTAMAIAKEANISLEEARHHIFMFDINGLLVKSRTDLEHHQTDFAQDYRHITSLHEAVNELQPTALIGASTVGGAFNESILRTMAENNERPIIFALSNPTDRAECTAEQAYAVTDARCVFASGSPFPPCTINGKTFYPGQGNNAYIFPGIALGAILNGVKYISDELFLVASEAVAEMVKQEHLDEGRVYPPLTEVRDVSVAIGTAIAKHCYATGIAAYYPEPEDKELFIRAQMYDWTYDNFEPVLYDWPDFSK